MPFINMAGNEAVYDVADTNIYQTNGYSGTDADVDDTERYTSSFDLTSKDGARLSLKFDGSGATDNLYLYVYSSLTSSFDGDEVAEASVNITSDGSEDIYTFALMASDYGHGHFRDRR
jgi:hypothetical protein